MKRLALILPVLLLAGCSSTNLAKVTRELAKDPAIAVIRVTTLYGSVSYTRIGGRTNEEVTVNADGSVTIKKP